MRIGRGILPIALLFGLLRTLDAEVNPAALDSLFLIRNYDELKGRLPQIAAHDRGHPAVLFYQAFLESNADTAQALYKKVIAAAPNTAFAEQALFRLGQYHFSMQQYGKARSFFSALFKKYPQSVWRDDAQYLYCLCVAAQGKTDSARVFLTAFVQKSQSPYIDQAVLDLEQLGGAMPPVDDYFTLQIALFDNREEAQQAVQKLAHVFSHVEILEQPETSRLAVTVGRFSSRERAQRYAELYIQPSLPTFKIISRKSPRAQP